MIPKIIHTSWFSDEKKSSVILECYDSWKDKLPEYKIIEWNSKNFDINIIPYTEQAARYGKWAFVSDYFRLWVLYHYGGLYMDSDVRVNNSFDKLLVNDLFIGWEDLITLGAHLIGSIENNPFIKACMEHYKKINFEIKNNEIDLTPMPNIITKIAQKKVGLVRNGNRQDLKHNMTIYPIGFLSLKTKDDANFAEHLCLGSWVDGEKNGRKNMELHYYKYYSNPCGRVTFHFGRVINKIKYLLNNSLK